MTSAYTLAAAPGRVPLLGHIPQLARKPLELFQSLRAHGDVVLIHLGPTPAYVINHPDLIRQILTTDAKKFDKGVQFEKARPYIGNGLLASSEPLHLKQRRLMQPAFHQTLIERYVEIMNESALATLDAWHAGQTIAVNPELLAFTLKTVTKTLFSVEVDARTVADFTVALPALLDGLTVRVALPFKFLERIPTPGNLRFENGRARLQAIIERILIEHRSKPREPADLLSMLVSARDEETGTEAADEQLHDEIRTMLLAGTETAANTLNWACYLLSTHPEIQRRLQAEVDEVVDGSKVSIEALRKLVFTRQVLTETLRLYPVVWLLSRRPIGDVELGGHRIPADSHVLFCPYALHHDPEHYPEPARFHPDRWQESISAKGVSRGSFLPFGAGIRGCIGEPYAWTEMLIFLSLLVRRFSLKPIAGKTVRPIVKGSLQPDHHLMRVELRTPVGAATTAAS